MVGLCVVATLIKLINTAGFNQVNINLGGGV